MIWNLIEELTIEVVVCMYIIPVLLTDEKEALKFTQSLIKQIQEMVRSKPSTITEQDSKRRAQLLIDAKILTEDGKYHPDFFSEETIANIKPITLIGRKYKVEQYYNDYFYFIEYCDIKDGFRWYVQHGVERFPEFFSIYDDFKDGFDTPELAMAQLEVYLKSSFPTK
jgi:hypothetical protein